MKIRIKPRLKIVLRPKKKKLVIRLKRKKPRMVPCGMCGGKHSKKCRRCRGRGAMPNHGVAIFKESPNNRIKIERALSIKDLKSNGFRKTGVPTEAVSLDIVLKYLKEWLDSPAPLVRHFGPRAHWEFRMAQAGWYRDPPNWEDVVERYKPRVREEPEKKTRKKAAPEGAVGRAVPPTPAAPAPSGGRPKIKIRSKS